MSDAVCPNEGSGKQCACADGETDAVEDVDLEDRGRVIHAMTLDWRSTDAVLALRCLAFITEVDMHSTADKKKIRKWMHRQRDKRPQPDILQLRRVLGFELIGHERKKAYR